MNKFIKVSMITAAVIFVALGIAGMVDGIVSLIEGGYADNIVLGFMVTWASLPCLFMYYFIKESEQNEAKRKYRGLR